MAGQHNGLWRDWNMNTKFKKVSIIGLGYIGLPTAALIASHGMPVIGVDIDENIISIINSGKVHIVEPELDILVHEVVNNKLFHAVSTPESADIFLITVPTPFKNDYEPDLSYVEAAVKSIAPVLQKGNLIILESTSPVGTTEYIAKQLTAMRPDLHFPHEQNIAPDIYMAYCPERVMPGRIIHELIHNDRIIGGMSGTCALKAKEFYRLFVKGECLVTDSRTAEMTKLTENAFRDVNIAFANELSLICDKLNVNVWELIRLANHHPRVNILQPGPGVGGHCIAVDPWFIVHAAKEEAKLIAMAREVNEFKTQFVINKILAEASHYSQPNITCLGLAYKPNTDDLRESPAIKIIEALSDFTVNIVEPNISELPASLNHKSFKLLPLMDAINSANIIVLLVAHKEFRELNEMKLIHKTILNFVNPDHYDHSVLPFGKKYERPVSDFGMMMMNRIYGQMFS
jgi:UDP-N-acetyl-D-mannosaminuronic acid dehydrogenase